MTINITGTNLTITDAMRAEINKAFDRLKKYAPHNKASLLVTQEKQGISVYADYVTDDAKGRATEVDRDFYKALRTAMKHVERQLKAGKQSFRKKGNSSITQNMSASIDAEDALDAEFYGHDENEFA
jgi:ribosomal subunit interface protein